MAKLEELGLVEKLTDVESYQVWKFKITVILKANSLYQAVTEETTEALHTAEWKKKDAQAQKIIVTTIDQGPLIHIINCDTAYDMWSKLQNIYQRDSEQQKCNLLQEFFGYTFVKKTDIATQISKLQNIAHRLKMLNANITQDMIISKILATLPENYKHFRSAWDSTSSDKKTVEDLTARLLQEEARENEEKEVPVAFKTQDKKCFKCNKVGHVTRDCKSKIQSKAKKCFSCNKMGHFSSNYPEKKQNSCSICKKTNHTDKDCFFRKKEDKICFLVRGNVNPTQWIIDSGSTSHMANNKALFKTIEKISTKVGIAKNNESMQAHGIGVVELQECELQNVIYVPELTTNLISVNAITSQGGEVIFTRNEVLIRKEGKVQLKGSRNRNGLYEIILERES